MNKNEIKEFVDFYIDSYGKDEFKRNESGQIILSNGATSLNLELFLQDVIEDFIELHPLKTTDKF